MIVSVMLRLVPAALRGGRIVGRVRVVETGEQAVVRSTDELVDFLRECTPEDPWPGLDSHGPLSKEDYL